MNDDLEIGARRLPRQDGPEPAVVEALGGCDATDLSDALHCSHHMDPGVRPLYPGMSAFAGPAVTVSVPSGSQEVRKIAMGMARQGDVLVVDARAVPIYAVLGGKLAEGLKRQGLAGVVIDGYVRDLEEIRDIGLPVLCRGHTIAASPKSGPGEVNVPVACGGVVVQPGDVIVADSNGAVVVPKAGAAALARKMGKG